MDLTVIPHSFASNIQSIATITFLSFFCSYLPNMISTFKNLFTNSTSHGFLLGFFLHELEHSMSDCGLCYPAWIFDLIHYLNPEVFPAVSESSNSISIVVTFEKHSHETIVDAIRQKPSSEPKSFMNKLLFKFFVNLVILLGLYFKFFVVLAKYIFGETNLVIKVVIGLLILSRHLKYIYISIIILSIERLVHGKYKCFWIVFGIMTILKLLFSNSHNHSHSHSQKGSEICNQNYSSISVTVKLLPFFCEAVTEGIVLAKERHHAMDQFAALFSLAIHKILEAGTIVGKIIHSSKLSDRFKLVLCIVYSLLIPISSLLFGYLEGASISEDGKSIVSQITLSALLHIVIFEVGPEMRDSKVSILVSAVSMLLVINAMELLFGEAH